MENFCNCKGCCVGNEGEGCCLSNENKECCISNESKGCCLSNESKGCFVSNQGEGCCVSNENKGCCVSIESKGYCFPSEPQVSADENMYRCRVCIPSELAKNYCCCKGCCVTTDRITADEREEEREYPPEKDRVCLCCCQEEVKKVDAVLFYSLPEPKFEGQSVHKRDFTWKPIPKKELPPWHPLLSDRWKSLQVPSIKKSTYQNDFYPPPPCVSKTKEPEYSVPEEEISSKPACDCFIEVPQVCCCPKQPQLTTDCKLKGYDLVGTVTCCPGNCPGTDSTNCKCQPLSSNLQ
ncbi:uncharacterized protein [Parasteatoda tepidariorum]|uniref:uncharacterized protein n=1 Tax=Parasteatoda tepidariorum TaxID=114398 RepID=UPI0039BCB628